MYMVYSWEPPAAAASPDQSVAKTPTQYRIIILLVLEGTDFFENFTHSFRKASSIKFGSKLTVLRNKICIIQTFIIR